MRLRSLLDIVLLGLMWGSSFLFIRLALPFASPITIAAMRIAIAAVVLLPILFLIGGRLPKDLKTWSRVFVMGLLANAIPFTLLSYSQLMINSSLAGMVSGIRPIIAVLLAHYFLTSERITLQRLLGVAVGFSGLIVLVLPGLIGPSSGEAAEVGALADPKKLMGMLCAFVAAISYAAAAVFGRRYLADLPPLVMPCSQMLITSAYMLPLALLLPGPSPIAIHSFGAWAALIGLAVWCTASALPIYSRVLQRDGPTYVSMASYFHPLISTVLGVLILGESMGWNYYIALSLIAVGVFAVSRSTRPVAATAELDAPKEP